MTILKFLQENAEWMCAIAIVIFTAVQCILTYQQNMQNIKMRRLELANKLDQIITIFLGSNNEAAEVMNWLSANASNFFFLLNSKDRESYKKLLFYLLNYKRIPVHSEPEMVDAIQTVMKLVGEIDCALGNANYVFVNEKEEFKPTCKEK
ncbi:hypothetical protein IJG14_03965 [bacterium]|nr:hypothetical protein [bacterium]MBQ3311660.1 hypothetical protein [bacterium]